MSALAMAAQVLASFEARRDGLPQKPDVSAEQAWLAFAELNAHVFNVGMVSPRVDELMRMVERFIQQEKIRVEARQQERT